MPKQHINNIDLYYEISGQGQPVVFIHGLGSSTGDWELQTPFFSKQFQVITLDVRGHGQSQKPPGPYSIPLFASDVAAFIEALDIAPAHIVGISMGGMIAFQLAVDRPDLIRSMVIVNSGPEVVPHTLKEYWFVASRLLLVYLFSMRKIGEVIGGGLFPKPEQVKARQQFVERWAENDKRAYVAAMRAIVGWSVTEHLPKMNIPTLILTGDRDNTTVEAKEKYMAKLPQAELVVIENSGHASPVDQPELFNEALMAYLAKQAS